MYKTILVPVDVYETALSDKALQHAQFLAQSACPSAVRYAKVLGGTDPRFYCRREKDG